MCTKYYLIHDLFFVAIQYGKSCTDDGLQRYFPLPGSPEGMLPSVHCRGKEGLA